MPSENISTLSQLVDLVRAVLHKALTFLVDRRGWAIGVVMAILALSGFFGLDAALQTQGVEAIAESLDASIALIAAIQVWVESLVKVGAFVALVWKLVSSWEKRPPTGLSGF